MRDVLLRSQRSLVAAGLVLNLLRSFVPSIIPHVAREYIGVEL